MELLELLNEGNEKSEDINDIKDIQQAIGFLLNLDQKQFEEASWYKEKQRFSKNFKTMDYLSHDYLSQREHAIDWFFSKALWGKKNKNGLQLKTIIKNIKCVPLLVYLAIVTGELEEDKAERIMKVIERLLNPCIHVYHPVKIISEERRILIKMIGKYKGDKEYSMVDFADTISFRLVNGTRIVPS